MLQLSKLRLREAKSLTQGHTEEPGFEVRSLQFQNPKAYHGPGLSLSVLNAPVGAAISNGGPINEARNSLHIYKACSKAESDESPVKQSTGTLHLKSFP